MRVIVSMLCVAAIEDSKMYSNASDHTISSNLQKMSDSPRYQVVTDHHTHQIRSDQI